MKKRFFLFSLLVLVILLGACQSAAPAVVETEQPAAGVPYPAAEAAKPEPGTSVLYPSAKDGDTLSWFATMAMIMNGEVKEITQDASLNLTVMLKDGRSFASMALNAEEVQKVKEACGNPCKDMQITNK